MPQEIRESMCDGYDCTEHDFVGDTVEVFDEDHNRMDLCPSCLALFYLDNPLPAPKRTLDEALEALRLVVSGQSETLLAEDARLIQLHIQFLDNRLMFISNP